jgi:hypothetical protein
MDSIAAASMKLMASLTTFACEARSPKRQTFWPRVPSSRGATDSAASRGPARRTVSLGGAGEQAAVEQHRARDLIIAQHREDDIAAESLLGGAGDLRAALREPPCRLRRAVPDTQRMARLQQPARDRAAHVAEPDEADVHDRLIQLSLPLLPSGRQDHSDHGFLTLLPGVEAYALQKIIQRHPLPAFPHSLLHSQQNHLTIHTSLRLQPAGG